jgi:hypothetical protein
MASGRHPILEDVNVFDRFNIHEKDRPAHAMPFAKRCGNEVRRRLG